MNYEVVINGRREFVEALDEAQARHKLTQKFGEIDSFTGTVKPVEDIPEGFNVIV